MPKNRMSDVATSSHPDSDDEQDREESVDDSEDDSSWEPENKTGAAAAAKGKRKSTASAGTPKDRAKKSKKDTLLYDGQYFTIIGRKGNNLEVRCRMCHDAKKRCTLSTREKSNSNILKHIKLKHVDLYVKICESKEIRPTRLYFKLKDRQKAKCNDENDDGDDGENGNGDDGENFGKLRKKLLREEYEDRKKMFDEERRMKMEEHRMKMEFLRIEHTQAMQNLEILHQKALEKM